MNEGIKGERLFLAKRINVNALSGLKKIMVYFEP